MKTFPHHEHVDWWLATNAEPLVGSRAIARLARPAMRVLWLRSKTSLGDSATAAIFDRVIADARHRFPLLEEVALAIDEGEELDSTADLDREELRDALRY